jgi:hypothetical protein
MQQHADLTRLLGGAALPLALLAQPTGATTADAGSIDHAQASVSFSALFMRDQLLRSGATQRAIGLEGKVLAREAARFPGQAHLRGSITRGAHGLRNEIAICGSQAYIGAFLMEKNQCIPIKEAPMTSIADGAVQIQTSAESIPSTPAWFGEVVVMAAYLRKHDVLTKIAERVRFTRRRFGRYEVIDFLAVLFGYAISGERTLEAFYERLQSFAGPFMALFERDHLPARSTLSRFVAALTQAPVEALRTLLLDDLLSRPLATDSNNADEKQTGGLMDRAGNAWVIFDMDGTREAARQRALPQTEDLPPPFRRLDDVCAPGYTGRKRGQVVRTRTVISQAHSFQWLGSFGNKGNGRYREELRQGLAALRRYLTEYQLPHEYALLRLDGQYGTGAALADLAGFAFVTRGKDYTVLDHPLGRGASAPPPRSVPATDCKVRWYAASTTASRCRWGPRGAFTGRFFETRRSRLSC